MDVIYNFLMDNIIDQVLKILLIMQMHVTL